MVGGFLPDTNILIYALKGFEPYASWFRKVIQEDKLKISVIVIAEFLEGATSEDEITLKRLVNKFGCLPIDRSVAEIGASYKKKYSRKSKKVWMSDCLIAATSKVFKTILVTANRKDFLMNDIEIISF